MIILISYKDVSQKNFEKSTLTIHKKLPQENMFF